MQQIVRRKTAAALPQLTPIGADFVMDFIMVFSTLTSTGCEVNVEKFTINLQKKQTATISTDFWVQV